MVYFLPLFILLIAPLVLTVFYRRWPRLALFWLGLIGITLVSWTILLLARLQLPIVFDALSWGLTDIFPSSPALVIDQSSWPYAMGLSTLLLAILITDVVRTYIIEFDDAPNLQVSWNSWVICTLAAGFALLAVLAKNPLTLVIGWTVLSIMELSHRLIVRKSDQDTQFSVLIFVARIIGIFFVIIAMISHVVTGLGSGLQQPDSCSQFLVVPGGRYLPGNLAIFHAIQPAPPVSAQFGNRICLLSGCSRIDTIVPAGFIHDLPELTHGPGTLVFTGRPAGQSKMDYYRK